MKRWRWALSLILLVSACSPAGQPTLESYAEQMNTTESEYLAALWHTGRAEYPIGGDLVGANLVFQHMERRLAGWERATAPDEFATLHDELVASMAKVQKQVAEYLLDESFAASDFEFESIAPKVRDSLEAATSACRALKTALREQGALVAFAFDCEI